MTGRLSRGLRRPVARGIVAVIAVFSATVVGVWWKTRERPSTPVSTDAVRVGVAAGGSIPGYLESTRLALAGYTGGDTYALVTFTGYERPAAVAAVLAGTDVFEVIVRVPLPGAQTEIVRLAAYRLPDDVLAGLDRVATRKEAEVAEYRRLATDGGAKDGDGRLRVDYAESARIAAAEATAMRERSACVYAAVVRGGAPALTGLAGRPTVRAVDPAPAVKDLLRTVFTPPLPEQSDVARPPAGR